MPSQQNKFPYVINSFRGGISSEDKRGPAGSYKFGYGLDIRKRADVLTCGYALAKDSGTTLEDFVRFIVPCTNGKSYHFGDTGKIYERSAAGAWVKRYADANGAIKGAFEWNGYLYWACNTKLSRIQVSAIPAATWNAEVAHDWQTLTAADWHIMTMACGNMMIGNKATIAMVDYAASAFTATALDLIPGNIAKALTEEGDYLIIGTTRSDLSDKGYLISWTTSATRWLQKKKLSGKGVNAIIQTELFLTQCGVDGEVFSDFSSKQPQFVFPDGGSCYPDAVDNRKGLALFGVNGSTKDGLYAYGRPQLSYPFALSLDYVPSHGKITGCYIGSVKMIDGSLFVSWKDGTTYGVDKLSANRATGVYESLEFDAGQPYNKKTFHDVLLTMNPLVNGCTITLKYKLDGASSWTTAKTIAGASSFSTALATDAQFRIGKTGRKIEYQITLTPTTIYAPEITSKKTMFSFTKGGNNA